MLVRVLQRRQEEELRTPAVDGAIERTMKGQREDVTEADENGFLDMKRTTYWCANGFMSQQYAGGEAV